MPPSSARRRPAAAAALAAVLAAVLLAAPDLGAQPLVRRIAAAGDGEVRLSYATGADVCGDGDEVVGLRGTLHVGTGIRMRGNGPSTLRCVPGPARVALRVRRTPSTAPRRTRSATRAGPGTQRRVEGPFPRMRRPVPTCSVPRSPTTSSPSPQTSARVA